jgi:flagellar hook-basal body complex protein FliE
MFIEPMKKWELTSLAADAKQQNSTAVPSGGFEDIFKNAVQNVVDTDKALVEGEYLLSTGQIEDAHTVPIAAAKAQLSLELLIQLRNKALESYNELMRINL